MYEVEVKSKLRDREMVFNKLESLGCKFSEVLHQEDHIYTPKGSTFPTPFEVPVLRIRKQNGKYIFTMKISQSSRQDSLERETEIGDGDKMNDILVCLGYQDFIVVDKERIKANVGDMEVVLDKVKDLGEFIEVEKVVTEENSEIRKKIQEELLDFLESIGVPRSDQVIDGKYDIMLHEKMNEK